MTTENLLIIVAVILLLSALPLWPYSRQWGYGPTGILGLIVVFLILWVVVGDRHTGSVGDSIQDGVDDAAHSVKELGRDVKESVEDAVR